MRVALKSRWFYLGLFSVFSMSFLVFYCSFFFQLWQHQGTHWVSDLPVHTQFVLQFSEQGQFPAYTLWYPLVYALSGFSSHFNHLAFVSMFLLATLIGLKYVTTYWVLTQSSIQPKRMASLISLALIFVMPILSYYTETNRVQIHVSNFHLYLGNISANQWHNSTLILAMPISIVLFYYSVKHLESKQIKPFFIMGLLATANVLCKPNYILAYLPVFFLSILALGISSRTFKATLFKIAALGLLPCIALVYQWYFTFIDNSAFTHAEKNIFSLFLVWRAYSPHLLLSLCLSILFPLVIVAFYYKKMDTYLGLAWLVFMMALLIFSVMAESPDPYSGNFLWGAICATYILFLFSAKLLLVQPFDYKAKIAYGVFVVHFFSGCFLLAAFFLHQKALIL